MSEGRIGSWGDVATLLRDRPPGTLLKVPKSWVGHPSAFGMRTWFDLPAGQAADYSKRLDDVTRLEVATYQRHYVARIHVSEPPQPTVPRRTPRLSGIVVGAILGAALGRSEQALLTGAAVGAAISATESHKSS